MICLKEKKITDEFQRYQKDVSKLDKAKAKMEIEEKKAKDDGKPYNPPDLPEIAPLDYQVSVKFMKSRDAREREQVLTRTKLILFFQQNAKMGELASKQT